MIDFNLVEPEPVRPAPIDYAHINDVALANMESVARWALPGGRVVRNEYVCKDIYGGEGNSCSTSLSSGRGSDFATGDAWGDPIDMVATARGILNSEAAKILQEYFALSPPPVSTPAPARKRGPDLERYERGRQEANRLFAGGSQVPDTFPYLEAKGVLPAKGLKLHSSGFIMVPLYDDKGVMWSVQRIYPNGSKRIIQDGRLTGNSFTIHGEEDTVYLAEGYATAATVRNLTGKTVVMCITAGNMPVVAEAVAKKYPAATLIVAADYDDGGDGKNPGVEAAEKAVKAAGKGTVLAPPSAPGTKMDWNDYCQLHGEGAAVTALVPKVESGINLFRFDAESFLGEPKSVEWVVENILAKGRPALLAAPGDSGKGMLTLELALQIAGPLPGVDFNQMAGWFGNPVKATGTVVILSAEDDFDEIHRRLKILDPTGERRKRAGKRLRLVPLPNMGGPVSLISGGADNIKTTEHFDSLVRQLNMIDDLVLINIDPLASFVASDINADPAAGAFTMGVFANLATQTGAAVLIAHHMNKTKFELGGPEQARDATRGSTALVDGVRTLLNLWPVRDKGEAKKICKAVGVKWEPNRVYQGAVTKSNGPADREVKTFIRSDQGYLEVRDVKYTRLTPEEQKMELTTVIQEAAEEGFPFRWTGKGSPGKMRTFLPSSLSGLSKSKLDSLVEELIADSSLVVAYEKPGTTKEWLDHPDGPYALGNGCHSTGARKVRK